MDNDANSENHVDGSLWKQLNVAVDLYKFFFEWVLKLLVFYYAATGAIVSFYLLHPFPRIFRHSLILPIVFSVFLFLLFLSGQRGLRRAANKAEGIGRSLKPEMELDLKYLPNFLVINAVMCIGTAAALTWLWRYHF